LVLIKAATDAYTGLSDWIDKLALTTTDWLPHISKIMFGKIEAIVMF